MEPSPRPCFNSTLLSSIASYQDFIRRNNGHINHNGNLVPVKYSVLASRTAGVFNYGGDLGLFHQLIVQQDREGLMKYARACIDVLYPNSVSFGLPLITISLVQGDALGGGFEAALSSNVIIAEESAQFGFPEVLFNLFPGMGAYSLLSRRITQRQAEDMILSGRMYSAGELFDMGLLDKVVEDGAGVDAVYEYVRKMIKKHNSYQAVLNKVRGVVNPLSYKELEDICHIWVDTALQITKRDLRIVQRIVNSQNKFTGNDDSENGNQIIA